MKKKAPESEERESAPAKKKVWVKPEVKVMRAGSAEVSSGARQEGGTGNAVHAS